MGFLDQKHITEHKAEGNMCISTHPLVVLQESEESL